jgi:hypothetical protein
MVKLFVRLMAGEQYLGMAVSHCLEQSDKDFSCFVRIGNGKTAFLNALLDDLAQQLRTLSAKHLMHSEAHNGITLGVPDSPDSDYLCLVFHTQPVQCLEEALQFFAGTQCGVVN